MIQTLTGLHLRTTLIQIPHLITKIPVIVTKSPLYHPRGPLLPQGGLSFQTCFLPLRPRHFRVLPAVCLSWKISELNPASNPSPPPRNGPFVGDLLGRIKEIFRHGNLWCPDKGLLMNANFNGDFCNSKYVTRKTNTSRGPINQRRRTDTWQKFIAIPQFYVWNSISGFDIRCTISEEEVSKHVWENVSNL
ncbi:hypothetical protein CEXT_75981 [Caerostris extrusa]|uniref:Uncharacterized protein n=1 Tax=Caerostris extrusa TaxID=172846 RepID=A0AAV4W2G9_CAEEX|nr:hypothetical protein CEXT_75981 [Caerostris extrusa]